MTYKRIPIDQILQEKVKEKATSRQNNNLINGSENVLLEWAQKEILQAPDGQKHNTLIKVAYTLGGFIASGNLSELEAFATCFDAICSKNIDDVEAARRTITDGLRVGQSKPLEFKYQNNFNQDTLTENEIDPEYLTTSGTQSERKGYVVSGEELLKNPIEILPTLWDPFFPQKGLVTLGGSSDTGKSTFLRQFGIAISSGETSFLGFPLYTKHQSALFVLTEDDDVAIRFLLYKQSRALGYNLEAYRNLRFIFESENLIEKLEKELRQQPADLVVIDAFSDLYEGDMNAGNKVRGFLNRYKERIADQFSCLVLFLHHTGKRTDDNAPSKHNLIGSQAYQAKMRVVAELRKDLNKPELRHLCFVKGNYLPDQFKEKSYELYFDENMMFRYTGVNVPFNQLANIEQEQDVVDDKLMRVALAFKMSKEGIKQEDIAKAVGLANKGGVNKWLKNEKYIALFE